MADFVFYQRTDAGTEEVARLSGSKFTGPAAEKVQELLASLGYKKGDDPSLLLHGSRLWAQEAGG